MEKTNGSSRFPPKMKTVFRCKNGINERIEPTGIHHPYISHVYCAKNKNVILNNPMILSRTCKLLIVKKISYNENKMLWSYNNSVMWRKYFFFSSTWRKNYTTTASCLCDLETCFWSSLTISKMFYCFYICTADGGTNYK